MGSFLVSVVMRGSCLGTIALERTVEADDAASALARAAFQLADWNALRDGTWTVSEVVNDA